MKKNVLKRSIFLKTLVALVLLTSILLGSILGVTKSEYFKSFSKKVGIEAKPDLMLEYALWDANATGNSTTDKAFQWEEGVYKNAESFSQKIVVGQNNVYNTGIYKGAQWDAGSLPFYGDGYPDNTAGNLVSDGTQKDNKGNIIVQNPNVKYNGEDIIYQIKLPVDETGYYVLNFQVDFLLAISGGGWASQASDFFTQTYDRAIGCEILNHNDGFTFKDNTKRLDLYSRSGNDCVHGRSKKSDAKSTEQKSYINKKYFEADSLYQWKTLSPSRAENVSLAFKVEPEDVDNGYVLWMWDFAGLFGARTWKLEFTDISVEKTMELDGSTDSRDGSSDPYFMFPQASFMNSQILLSLDNINDLKDYDYPLENLQTGQLNYNVRSVQHRGKTSYSKGRGTFATSATANSLTFQAESLFFGYGNEDFANYLYLDEQDKAHAGNGHSNPVAVYIPLKNIQYNTDYKVTFDISFARQGKYNLDKDGNPAAIQRDRFYGYNYNANMFGSYLADYVDPSKYTAATSSASATNELFRKGEHLFSSYLLSNKATNVNRIEDAHVADMGLINYADKHYQGAPLTKYDEINSLTNINNTTVESVNNTYSKDILSSNPSMSRNWFNAVQHTEYNGQNEIHWLTFYNTTFSFNIPEAENSSINLDDLYWVWAMDSLISGCYYRIKLENVRIEKVVKYTSSLNPNGVQIAGTQINLPGYSVADSDGSLGYDATDDIDKTTNELNIFRSFRGINGTGQNYQAKGFVLDESTAVADKVFTSEGNIYAPIIDATKFNTIGTQNKAYQIALDGFAVCQGGVSRYVYSIDGGQTWQNMTFSGGKASNARDPEDLTIRDQLTLAERGVNQYVSGQTRYNEAKFTSINDNISKYTHVDFTDADGANANFSGFKLVADLSKYKHQANLDVIIAAVPMEDANCRCEILRIINFNQIRNYMTFPFDFVSDIKVNGSNGTESPLNVNRLDESNVDTGLGHYNYSKVDPEAMGFTFAKTYILADDTTSGGKKGPSSTTGYARIASNSYDYEDIRTLYSDFPVKTSLGLTGWAIVEGGVDAYYWTADNGKTWVPCNSMDTTTNTATSAAAPKTRNLVSAAYKKYYYDGVAFNPSSNLEDEALRKNHCFRDSIDGEFDGVPNDPEYKDETGKMIAANLSKYVGEVVDVIFAAKPAGSDVYVPVGRIDNVAVYGDKGTFYTHINSLTIDGNVITPDYFDVDNKPLNHVTKSTNGTIVPQWDLGYIADNAEEFSYTIYEPNNVNAFNSRLYNNEVNVVQSGSQVVINGYTVISHDSSLGSAKPNQYWYTLDGGDSWSKVQQKSTKDLEDSYLEKAKQSDSSLDYKGRCANYYHEDTGYLTFPIPALPDGAERTLTVVAKNEYGSMVPVLNIKLKIENENVGYFVYNGHDAATADGVQCGYYSYDTNISQPFSTYEDPMRYKMTFPVSQEGIHTLTFNSDIDKINTTTVQNPYTDYSTSSIVRKEEYSDYFIYGSTTENNKTHYNGWKFGSGTVTMSVPQLDYYEGDTSIDVNFAWDVTNVKQTGSEYKPAINSATIGIYNAKVKYNNSDVTYFDDYIFFGHVDPASNRFKGEYNENGEFIQTWHGAGDKDKFGNHSRAVLDYRLSSYGYEGERNATHKYSGTASLDISNLKPGTYKIAFINYMCPEWPIENVKRDLPYYFLTPEIEITIHSKAEAPEGKVAIVHDVVEKGGELFYASSNLIDYDSNTVDKVAVQKIDNIYASNDIELYFNATKEDVKRGYVVLNWDLSGLDDNSNYVMNIKNLRYCYGVKSTKHLTTDAEGNAWYTIKVPALEVGTHEFAFSSYASAYSPVIHKGLDQSDKKIDGHNGSNYKAAGAYMSVPKTVYNVGEPIHVSYSMAGAHTDYGQWIGISRAIDGRDAVIAFDHVHDNGGTEGIVTLKPGMSKCEVGAEEFANLPAGSYKIYFRDFSANVYRGKEGGSNDNKGQYWPDCNITDPISITIIDPNKKNNKPYKQTCYFDDVKYKIGDTASGADGYISLDKTVFRVGEDINFTYEISNNFGNATVGNEHLYIGICRPNGPRWNFAYLEDGKIPFNKFLKSENKETQEESLVPGRYQLICCDGSFENARKIGSVMAVIDIVILPPDGENPPVMDLTYLHGNDGSIADAYNPISAYTYSRNPITINVTQADVDRGFVEFKYELKNLVENTDIVYTTEMFYNRKLEEDPYIKEGNYIYFGEYPQSHKDPSVNIENVAPDSRGYYKGDDGYYYAKVTANPYDKTYTFVTSSDYIVKGEVYYFKVEPIKWRILKEGDGYYDILCESIIANRPYDGDSNKYANSDVRTWLNDTFYKTAFTELQKKYILEKDVDNSLASTGYTANSYVSDNTNDKICLPSYATVTNTEYGFINSNNEADLNRAKAVTDYARATGAWTNMSEWDNNMGNGIWMLRSPADSASNFIREGYFNGEITDGGIAININAHGVAPMLRLAFASNASEYNIYKVITRNVGDKTTYRGNYSALMNNVEQDAIVHYNAYTGSYMSVPKTYFVEGEPIPVSYKYTNTYDTNTNTFKDAKNAWICIASTGEDNNIEYNNFKDTYIRYFQINKGDSNTDGVDITKATLQANNAYAKYLENLPAGEYKIWFIYGPAGSGYWWDYDKATHNKDNYNNPYKEKCAVTDPISIKILSRTDPNPDCSLTYKAWIGKDSTYNLSPMYSYIKLEKNVFNQDEGIKMAFNGRTLFMTAFLLDTAGNVVNGVKPLYAAAATGAPEKLASWSSFYEMEGSKNLAPGKYKLYYAVEDSLAEIYNIGSIVTILDITILPKDVTKAPTLKLDVIYTSTSGQTVRKTINENVMLNNLLNSHIGNYNLTDNGNKVEGIVDLTGVKANTDVQFVFYYKKNADIDNAFKIDYEDDESIKITVDNVPWETWDIEYSSVTNFAITKTGYKFNNKDRVTQNNYPDAKLSVAQTYFEYGKPINISYSAANYTDPRIFITTNKVVTYESGIMAYSDCYVKMAHVKGNGTVDVNVSNYTAIQSDFKTSENTTEADWHTLPPGEYKVWMINNAYLNPRNPYNTYVGTSEPGHALMTEPITIKVIDPNEPDFSLTYGSYAPYSGTYGKDQGIYDQNTKITLEKNVFTQGEKIYFTIGLDYGAKHVLLSKAEQFNLLSSYEYTYDSPGKFYSEKTKGKYWQYAEHGKNNTGVENSLDTTGLEPGQYKLYYMFGQFVQQALRGDVTTMNQHLDTAAKVYAIIDIYILPKPTDTSSSYTQTVTVNYTKFDGTSATVSRDFNINGEVVTSGYQNGKVVNKYYQGIDFVRTITDIKPDTEITLSVTTNLPNDLKNKATTVVLKNTKTKKYSYQ